MRMLAAALSVAFATGALAAEPVAASAGAPTVPATAGAPSPISPEAPARYGKSSGLVPGLLIGPKLSLITLPAPGFGLDARIGSAFGLSLDLNLIPTVAVGDAAKVSYRDVSGAARWFPFRGSFYLGAALGSRTFKASVRDETSGALAKAEVTSTYLAPELGWRWIWSSGFFLGMDLGYQIILSNKLTFDLPILVPAEDRKDVQDAANDLGKIGFPIVSLLQLGWYF